MAATSARAAVGRPGLHAGRGAVLLALGGLLLALRAAGEQLGWGSAPVTRRGGGAGAALYADRAEPVGRVRVWPVRCPGAWPRCRRATRRAMPFLTGVLAVAIASCTAPFMGAALGFAIDARAPQALAVFAPWHRHGPAPPAGRLGAAVAGWLPRPVRGWTPSAAPWPSHVCHRGMAGGCWASKAASTAQAPCWHCWWRQQRGVGPDTAGPHALSWCRC